MTNTPDDIRARYADLTLRDAIREILGYDDRWPPVNFVHQDITNRTHLQFIAALVHYEPASAEDRAARLREIDAANLAAALREQAA